MLTVTKFHPTELANQLFSSLSPHTGLLNDWWKKKFAFPFNLTCKIELSKLAAIVAVIILGRFVCFAVNDPGTYEDPDDICESVKIICERIMIFHLNLKRRRVHSQYVTDYYRFWQKNKRFNFLQRYTNTHCRGFWCQAVSLSGFFFFYTHIYI